MVLHNLLQYSSALPEQCSPSDDLCAVHRGPPPADLHSLVAGFLSKMEAAVWADVEANKQQRPAVAKLSLLPEMQRIFTNKKVHLPSSPLQETQPCRIRTALKPLSSAWLSGASICCAHFHQGLARLLPHLPVVSERGLDPTPLKQVLSHDVCCSKKA